MARGRAGVSPVSGLTTPNLHSQPNCSRGIAVKGSAIASAASPAPTLTAVSATAVPKATPVTLTGCVVQADDTFRLKDTAGASAPKARIWKTGFLKKGSASIEVVDAADDLTLANHVDSASA